MKLWASPGLERDVVNRFRVWFEKLWKVLRNSVNRFPETLLFSAAFVVVMIVNNRMDSDPGEVLERVAMVLALGIPLSAIIKLLLERYRLSVLYRIAADVALVAYAVMFYLLLPEELDSIFGMRYGAATIIAYLVFTLVPYLWRRTYYSLYCVKLMVSFLITYLYTLVLYLGVIAIIFAVDFLFELNIGEEIYFDTFIAAVGIFGLTYFLGKVPEVAEDISWYRYPKVLRILLVSIVVPLISIYTVVLYAYLVRILVAIGWSGSFVSQLVIWYGFASVALLILLAPLMAQGRLVRRFYRIYPIAMLVPMAMLAISMIIRIDAYGLTVPRGVVMLSWFWFVIAIIELSLRKDKEPQALVTALVLVFIIGMFSPVNVFTISNSHQISRLTGYLEDMDMIRDNQVVARDDLGDGDRILVSDILSYLEEYRGLQQVSYLPEGFTLKDMRDVFGFTHMQDRSYVNEYGRIYIEYHMGRSALTDIKGYDFHSTVMNRPSEDPVLFGKGVELTGAEGSVILYLDGEITYETSIEDLLTSHKVDLHYSEGETPPILLIEEPWGRMKLLFTEYYGYYEEDDLELDFYRIDVFIDIHE